MSSTVETLPSISGESTMGEVLRAYPGAQRALFARYHIGGCQSCGFQPGETLAGVCQRNENLPVEEVIQHIQDSHRNDVSLQVTPAEFTALRQIRPSLRVLDVRTREEHEAVKIPGSVLMTRDLLQEIFGTWDKTEPVILYDHHGARALDAVAYFVGHGFAEAKSIAGGIDAYSQEVDHSLPRYRVELED